MNTNDIHNLLNKINIILSNDEIIFYHNIKTDYMLFLSDKANLIIHKNGVNRSKNFNFDIPEKYQKIIIDIGNSMNITENIIINLLENIKNILFNDVNYEVYVSRIMNEYKLLMTQRIQLERNKINFEQKMIDEEYDLNNIRKELITITQQIKLINKKLINHIDGLSKIDQIHNLSQMDQYI